MDASLTATRTARRRHAFVARDDVRLAGALPGRSSGLTRAVLVGEHTGSVHTGFSLVELGAGGHVDAHVHSYESSFYVLAGNPVLYLDGRGVRLEPGACGALPVGAAHAWRAPEPARWLEMAAPCPRGDGRPPDTFFLGPAPGAEPAALDLRDPRNRHLFRLGEHDMDLDRLRQGAEVAAPTVSASMATAALAYSGITVKMLVDKRLDAQLHTMFMVAYEPGGVAHPHDHPFEETYYMLGGEIDVVADGERHTLRPGDVFWTGVGCIHAFYEVKGGTALWLETSAPGPPDRHSYRFERDWEYLASEVEGR
jgi:quercetin dioxygenase-like cupin family protein